MIQWILEHLGIVIVIAAFVAQMVRGVMQQLRARKSQEREMRRGDGDEERRVREVQEQIRRQIAARRGGQVQPDSPPVLERHEEPAPLPRAETTQMPEPFGGGPLGRMLEELQRKAQQRVPAPPPAPVLVERRNQAELERQYRLADELKAAEDARHVVQRRAAHATADRVAAAGTESALRKDARGRLLTDLREPESLRRAFVLKEVLGSPVGLR
jgi:hypothetical protein